MKTAIITLSNGAAFPGLFFGAEAEASGEGIIHSGSTGYTSAATNTQNAGKILVSTFPMIGNYGIIKEEIRSDKNIAAHILFEWCENPSNFACEGNIDDFYKARSVAGVCAADTRALLKELGGLSNKTIKISFAPQKGGE